MKGAYVLIMYLKVKDHIGIGRLGELNFNKGYYAYIGSAMNGIENRVRRHLNSQKKIHWHIDHFMEDAKVISVYYKESKRVIECEIARMFEEGFNSIHGFGSSDCKCRGHLFFGEKDELIDHIEELEMKALKMYGQ